MAMTRRKRALVALAIGVPFVLVGAAFVAAEATKSNSFCGTRCHEMLPYHRTWEASAHAEVDCVGCHIPPGLWNYVKTKFFALREVWVHLTDKDIAPIAVTRHVPDEVCTGCHPPSQTTTSVTLAEFTTDFSHSGHSGVPLCIACHARVVHDAIPEVPSIEPRKMAACFECHDGKVQSNACVYCHSSPHADRGECQTCHNLKSWTGRFSHDPRHVDAHAKVPCERCHPMATGSDIGSPTGCVDCHEPPHPLKLADMDLEPCAECHTIAHWRPTTFDHPKKDCIGCHGDHHDVAQLTQCQDCHSQQTWLGASHTPALESAHRTVACQRCHTLANRTTMGYPAGCFDCHEPPHPLTLAGMNLRRCYDCHTITHWYPTTFDHPGSGCVDCHGNQHGNAQMTQCQLCHNQRTWAGATHPSTNCTSCHSRGPLHAGLSSQCQSCHVPGAYWSPSTYRHRQVGEHVPSGEERLACTQCHKTTYASATCTPCHGPGGPGGD